MADIQRIKVTIIPTTRRAAPSGKVYMEKAGRVVVQTSGGGAACTLSLLPATALKLANILALAVSAADNGDPFDSALEQV